MNCIELHAAVLHWITVHCRRSPVTACPRFMDNSRQGSRFHGAPNPIFLTITCLIQSKVDFSLDLHRAEAGFQKHEPSCKDCYAIMVTPSHMQHSPRKLAHQRYRLFLKTGKFLLQWYLSESHHSWCQNLLILPNQRNAQTNLPLMTCLRQTRLTDWLFPFQIEILSLISDSLVQSVPVLMVFHGAINWRQQLIWRQRQHRSRYQRCICDKYSTKIQPPVTAMTDGRGWQGGRSWGWRDQRWIGNIWQYRQYLATLFIAHQL